jgi:recombination protein RecA
MDIRRIGAIKRGDEIVGNETRVKVVKNKMAPPFRQTEFEILYGEGVSREGELIDLGVQNGLVDKAGAWYSYNGDRIGQGKDNVRKFLIENPEIANDIDTRLREMLLPKKESIRNREVVEQDSEIEAEA